MDWSNANAPAWFQAVFSVIAILAAVGVAYWQNEAQRRRNDESEQSELRGLLRSLCAELTVSLQQLEHRIGPDIRGKELGQPFLFTFPLTENPFHIYDALIPKIGTIKDIALQHAIIRTYAIAKGLVASFRFNNEMLATYEGTLARVRARNEDQCHADAEFAVLAQYGDALQTTYNDAVEQARKLTIRLGTT